MKHFLAYGHSDQASFRSAAVQASFDFLTVPGTIAAYYPDATAAFVLSSGLDYMVDPRTPLFQGEIALPKASHYSLAEWHGRSVRSHMGDDKKRQAVTFGEDFYTDDVVDEVVDSVVEYQRGYGDRAASIQGQLDRYARLAAEAQGVAFPGHSVAEGKRPSFVLAPYFVMYRGGRWRDVNVRIWNRCAEMSDGVSISPVVAVDSIGLLPVALASVPPELASSRFFWISKFDERLVSIESLTTLWRTVRNASADKLVNLYGGFFSICLSYASLWGFNNGLGYSEARGWPDLPTTGAAPARYYVPRLHAYASQGLAHEIVTVNPNFACGCAVCVNRGSIIAMTYHELKQHFALVRKGEVEVVTAMAREETARDLLEAAREYSEDVAPYLPPTVGRFSVDYLRRWASVIVDNPS